MPSKNPKQAANKSQKGQGVPNFTEDQARAFFEQQRWPNGPACVHCGSVNVYRMQGESFRPGLLRCRDCEGQFSVTVGTVMEDSHLPLSIWAKAFHLIASSKKGMSALQLQRNLGIGSYRTAWFLAHRIREAMRAEPIKGMLKGQIQADETYVGGKPRPGDGKKHKRGRGTSKTPVLALVETDGKVRSKVIETVDSGTLLSAMAECVDRDAQIVSDECPSYPIAAGIFNGGHETVNHSQGQYVRRGINDKRELETITTNAAESYFSLLKRGVYGTFHHVSKKHLHRYCNEFDFRWNGRELEDAQRRNLAVRGAEGKRSFYKKPIAPEPPHDGDQLPMWED